jgi:hypothetical protein
MNTIANIANIAIPSPRQPHEQTTPVAEIIRRRLVSSTSTSELRHRLANASS